MNYSVEVSKNGVRLFVTETTDLGKGAAFDLVSLLVRKFPEREGYKVVCRSWERVGQVRELADLNY